MIAGCHLSGADRIFRIGGAQAIAAMAYGTQSVPGVNKIFGPGNAYVNEAKRQVFGPVGIDQLAGPSEIFVVGGLDRRRGHHRHRPPGPGRARHPHPRRPHHHRQGARRGDAEGGRAPAPGPLHGGRRGQVLGQCRRNLAVRRRGGDDRLFGPCRGPSTCRCTPPTRRPWRRSCANYGSLFIGKLASVVYSDKCCGTNHTLPTGGAGRYTGGLWVGSYVKICTHQWLDERGVDAVAPPAVRQSASEGLEGHRRAAALRLEWLQRPVPGQN